MPCPPSLHRANLGLRRAAADALVTCVTLVRWGACNRVGSISVAPGFASMISHVLLSSPCKHNVSNEVYNKFTVSRFRIAELGLSEKQR